MITVHADGFEVPDTAPAPAHAPAPDLASRLLRVAAAAALAESGYIHAQLYIDGYRYIHVVGVLFLLQAAASFAMAALLLAGTVLRPPVLVEPVAAATALGALGGFVASRTVGVFGFIEHGWQPTPQALTSVLVEVAAVLLLAGAVIRATRLRKRSY